MAPPAVVPEEPAGPKGGEESDEHRLATRRTFTDAVHRFTLQSKLAQINEYTSAGSKVADRKKRYNFDPLGERTYPAATLVILVVITTVAVYGAVRLTQLLHHDVYGGVRCAKCSLQPYKHSILCAAAGGVVSIGSLVIGELCIQGFHDVKALNVLKPKFGRLVRIQHTVPYEVVQFAVSLFCVVTWNYGMLNLAQINIPGDKLHMQYVIGGHKHRSKEMPGRDPANPLAINSRNASFFYVLELLGFYLVAMNAILSALAQLTTPLSFESYRAWLRYMAIEAGTLLGIGYPRIFDHWGWHGARTYAYSPFVFFGIFRLVRCNHIVHLVYSLYSRTGIQTRVFNVNGVKVRYYALSMRLLLFILCAANLICFLEYPCDINAERENRALQAADCNAWFKRYDACIYFMVVTFSTVGYGDMYAATREGRGVMMLIIAIFVLQIPNILAEIQELSDGDDVSDGEKLQLCVAYMWKDVAVLSAKMEDLAGSLEAIAGLHDSTKRRHHLPLHPEPSDDLLVAVDDVRTRQSDLVAHVGEALRSFSAHEQHTRAELERIHAALMGLKFPAAAASSSETHHIHHYDQGAPPPKQQQQQQQAVQQPEQIVLAPSHQPTYYVEMQQPPSPQYFVAAPHRPSSPHRHDYAGVPETAVLVPDGGAPPRPLYYLGGPPESRAKHDDDDDHHRRRHRKSRSPGPNRKHSNHRSSKRHADDGPNDLPPNRPLPGFYTDLPPLPN